MDPTTIVMLGAFVTAFFTVVGYTLAKAYSRKIDAEAKNPRKLLSEGQTVPDPR